MGRANNYYSSGEWIIEKGEWGYLGGIEWSLWCDGELVSTHRTLKAAKKAAAVAGQVGEWTKGRVTVQVAER